TTTPSSTPRFATGLGKGSGVVAVAAGGSTHSLALKADGAVLAWGDNSSGQLGDGTKTRRLTPVPVAGLGTGSGVIAVAASDFANSDAFSLALRANGAVLAWVGNTCAQLGLGT